jgi:hypothetical protein
MLILLDHSTPAPLRYSLLDAAEAAGFEVFVTAGKNIRYQQNLTSREISRRVSLVPAPGLARGTLSV